jgi:hypothetical protein
MPTMSAATPELVLPVLRWIISQQNRDGSWGNSRVDQIRWTANALLTFADLGFNSRFPPVARATQFLLDYPQHEVNWYLKIPALLSLGHQKTIENNGDLEALLKLFLADKIGILPFKAALALDLKKSGIEIPGLEKLENTILESLDEESGLLSFARSTNETSLYCEFLTAFFPDKHEATVRRCIEWLCVKKSFVGGDRVCWERSYGKTAYVVINLLEIPLAKETVDQLIDPVLRYFRPGASGAIAPDTVAAIESKSSIYTSILFVRMTAAVARHRPQVYRSLFASCFEAATLKYTLARYSRILAKTILPSVFIVALAVGAIWYFGSTSFWGSVVASIVAAGLIVLITKWLGSKTE